MGTVGVRMTVVAVSVADQVVVILRLVVLIAPVVRMRTVGVWVTVVAISVADKVVVLVGALIVIEAARIDTVAAWNIVLSLVLNIVVVLLLLCADNSDDNGGNVRFHP